MFVQQRAKPLTLRTVTIFVVVTCVIFTMPNTVFAWFEYCTSLIKIVLFILIILLSLAIVCGAGPKGYVHHGETWTEFPAFKNGFSVRPLVKCLVGCIANMTRALREPLY